MAKCQECKREMLKARGCNVTHVDIKGGIYPRIKYGDDREGWDCSERCHDCGAVEGNYHHLGCDVEMCPKCEGQFISCSCYD